jgi:murein DD-endopeptidase MepM/ murein hydrolase activator NlpD
LLAFMKRRQKNYSVIIVSDATSSNREFLLSSKLIKNSIISVSVLLLFFGFVLFDYLTTSYNKEKMRKLEQDNIKKEKIIENMDANLKTLERSIRRMERYKEKIMIASGLKSPYALKEVGSGGYYDEIVSKSSPLNQNKKNSQAAPKETIIQKAHKITETANSIENTLKLVQSVIDKQKVRLACTPAIWPTKGYLTDPFGWRTHPITGRRSFHYGQDIATQLGNKIIATANGFVLAAERRGALGNLIIIDHNFGFTTWYGHLASFNVKEGDRVKRGQIIGYVGSTGRSNAPHLHYEVRVAGKPQNPMKFIID